MKTGLLLLFLTLLVSPAEAGVVWKIRDQVLDVVPCPNKNCYISRVCLEKKNSCDALKAYTFPKKGAYTGPNPGSPVCRKEFSGKILVATDAEGNQEGFCVFPDETLLSLSGVWK